MAAALREDLRTGKIPNRLNVTLFLAAIIIKLTRGDFLQADSLKVLLFLAVLMLPLWILNLLGAGDIKFLAGLGNLLYWPEFVCLMAYSLAMSVLYFVLFSIYKGRVVKEMPYMLALFTGYIIWLR